MANSYPSLLKFRSILLGLDTEFARALDLISEAGGRRAKRGGLSLVGAGSSYFLASTSSFPSATSATLRCGGEAAEGGNTSLICRLTIGGKLEREQGRGLLERDMAAVYMARKPDTSQKIFATGGHSPFFVCRRV